MTDAGRATPRDILQAGGLLSIDAAAPDDLPIDRVSARTWRHPALGDRPVVRLEADLVAGGVDVEMSLLGFDAPTVTGPVGQQRRRPLGFPGRPLLSDPGRARLALDVTKSFRAEARRAHSKPSFARDGFVKLAGRLGEAAPHFLPSFWEEAGRVFIDAGNPSYAAMMFEKARQAEREFGLPVDEDLRWDAFLEFALAGALAVKSLTAYARDLEKAWDPDRACELFVTLAVKRVTGGLPPWAGMAVDLRRMFKAAKRDVVAEEEKLLERLIDAPAMVRAPGELWKQYGPALVRLAKRSAHARGRLLNLFPRPPSEEDDFVPRWLALLEDAGAIDAVLATVGNIPREAGPTGSAAAWFSKLVARADGTPLELFRLLRRMAPRLVADGIPIRLTDPDGWYEELSVDLLDLALELGVPVADPGREASFDLNDWARGEGDADEPRPRDPVFVAADVRFRKRLEDALDNAAGEEDFEAAARGKRALAEARRRWLIDLSGRADTGGLPLFGETLETLEERTAAPIFAEFPEAYERLRAVDPVQALWRTLRAGLMDELAWPDFEEAWLELRGAEAPSIYGAFPYLILHGGTRVVVIGPAGRALEHDLRLAKGCHVVWFMYAGGQLLVVFRNPDYDYRAYWTGRPAEVFEFEHSWYRQAPLQITLADGAVSQGARPVHAGDTAVADPALLFSDGAQAWVLDTEGEKPVLRAIDLRTGTRGAPGLPAFLADAGVEAGLELDLEHSLLFPIPRELEGTPLGAKQGVAGWRVVRVKEAEEDEETPDALTRPSAPPLRTALSRPAGEEHPSDVATAGTPRAEGIDGRAWHGLLADGALPDGLLTLPGDSAPRPITQSRHWRGGWNEGFELWSPDGTYLTQTSSEDDDDDAQPTSPLAHLTLPFWHALRPRDPAGSDALRQIDAASAAALLATAKAELEQEKATAAPRPARKKGAAAPVGPRAPATRASIAQHLPGLKAPGLIDALVRELRQAADLALRWDALVAGRDPAKAPSMPAGAEEIEGDLDDSDVRDCLGPLAGDDYASGDSSRALRTRSAFLEGAIDAAPNAPLTGLPSTDLPWWEWLGRGRALAFAAAAPGLEAEEARTNALRVVEQWRDSAFAAGTLSLRVATLRFDSAETPFIPLDPEEEDEEEVLEHWLVAGEAGNRYVVHREGYGTERPIRLTVVEQAQEGRFVTPHGAVLEAERRIEPVDERAWLEAFLREAKAHGPRPFPAGFGARLAEALGLTRAEATLLWAGLPGMRGWQRDFLGKALRERLELKVAEAEAAREPLMELKTAQVAALFASACPDDPAGLWDEHEPVKRLAAAWRSLFGERVALPEGLLIQLQDELELEVPARELLMALAAPDRPGRFDRDGKWRMDSSGDVVAAEGGEAGEAGSAFDAAALSAATRLLPWLIAAAPVGDPLRDALPGFYRRVNARLLDPGLLLPLTGWWYEDRQKKKLRALVEGLGGEPWRPVDADEDFVLGLDNGAIVGFLDSSQVAFAFRPARIERGEQREAVERLWKAGMEESGSTTLIDLELWRSPGFAAMVERIQTTPVALGGWEAHPSESSPGTVTAAQEKLGLSADASILYLQILTLAAPTDRALQRWNDWKPARLKKAGAELVEKGLVVQAKRARAGRELFLPGGWHAIKEGADLPLETWKFPLYRLARDKEGNVQMPLGRILPLEPLHRLFEKAWERVVAGDRPGFEDKEKKKRS